ncbi:hypothetical protein FQR65_LT01037 [Abscondita terminalis]|nr:hypothetical protein FQR65_LT01037 [Abscondita terminalis]
MTAAGTSLTVMLFLISVFRTVTSQASFLEVFIPQYRFLTDSAYKGLIPLTESENNFQKARKMGKLQPTLNESVPFPCDVTIGRSKIRPTTVHALRPGDIDVIGAIGDSLTAGNGLIATDIIQTTLQNRGLSFSGGGQSNWRTFTTLPNILKEFNPKLKGYALRDSFVNQNYSQLNVAEAGAMSIDMYFMSKEIISRIKNNPEINFNEDWKVIVKDLSIIRDVSLENRPPPCYFTHNFVCPCLFGLQFRNQQNRLDQIMTDWKNIEKEVAALDEFDRDEFTVVLQPFAENYDIKRDKSGLVDYSVFSYDCFHLSQKEHGRAATSLWNNLLEPVGLKSTYPSEVFNFLCPTSNRPFIYTRRNSAN